VKIALFSDIHGNLTALDAVLADINRRGGVDSYIVNGDLVAIGPEPVEVLERLSELENVVFTRGNTDRYVVTGDRPEPTFEEAAKDPNAQMRFIDCANSFSWTQGAIATHGWWDWLNALSVEYRFTLLDGSSVLCVHASPGRDDGSGIHEYTDMGFLRSVAKDADSEYLFVGHTHSAVNFDVDGTHIWNLGSVSNPLPPDLRASYLILESTQTDTKVVRYRVAYDFDKVIEITQKRKHPTHEYIRHFFLGKCVPIWRRPEQDNSNCKI
jgi:predicted phosphodiesterase